MTDTIIKLLEDIQQTVAMPDIIATRLQKLLDAEKGIEELLTHSSKVSILSAFRRGDVVLIETDDRYSTADLDKVRESAAHMSDFTGLKLCFLSPGMKVAGRQETYGADKTEGA